VIEKSFKSVMKISELFYSVQGEGKRSGFPSFFIRTNYCNLRCQFPGGNLCDTSYTSWNPEDKNNLGIIEIDEIIKAYKIYSPVDVVITGGEPTIQLEELNILCKEIKKISDNIFITIETNGTFIGDFVNHINLMSISPKLNSSVPIGSEYEKMHQQNRINSDVLKKYNELYINKKIDVQWKFVVNDESDMNEIILLSNNIGFKNNNIFLMPEGITKEEIEQKRPVVIELCKKYKMNYTDRLQILIWGNKRGK